MFYCFSYFYTVFFCLQPTVTRGIRRVAKGYLLSLPSIYLLSDCGPTILVTLEEKWFEENAEGAIHAQYELACRHRVGNTCSIEIEIGRFIEIRDARHSYRYMCKNASYCRYVDAAHYSDRLVEYEAD